MTGQASSRLAACAQAIDEFLEQQGDALNAAASNPLIVRARDAGDRDEEDRLLSVLEEVEALVPQVMETFRSGLLAGLNGPGDAHGAQADAGGDDGLSLVETAKVDDWLRLRGMLERQPEGARRVEADIWARLSALADVDPNPDSSPVSLQCICVQFQAAMQGFAPGREARAAIYDAFEATVVAELGRLAARLLVLLDAETGVTASAPVAAPSSGAGQPVRDAAGGDGPAPSDRASPDSGVDPMRVLGAMAAVQRRELDSPLGADDDLETRLVESIAPQSGMTLDEGEQRTVSAVSRLVREIVSDPDVDPAVRRRLSLLAPPLLMLALQGEDYLEAEMYSARHDPVTGLLDRAAFRTRLEASCRQGPAAVCLVDVDGFDRVAGRLGHQVAGRLLRALADMLRKQAGRRNVVARLRGDEFAVLLPGAKPGAGRRFADRYLASLSGARFVFGGEQVELHASIGVVESDAALASPGDLMRAADAVRNEAKTAGGSCVRIHS